MKRFWLCTAALWLVALMSAFLIEAQEGTALVGATEEATEVATEQATEEAAQETIPDPPDAELAGGDEADSTFSQTVNLPPVTINAENCYFVIFVLPCNGQTTRTIVIPNNASERRVTELKTDLLGERGALPAANITSEAVENPFTLNPGPNSYTLTIQTNNVAPSAYKGNLLLVHEGGSFTIPLEVNVKDPFPLPLLVLVLGVGVGSGLTIYRTRQLPRDTIVVKLQDLTQRKTRDPDIETVFGANNALSIALDEVDIALDNDNVEEAETQLKAADALFRNWRQNKPGWLSVDDFRTRMLTDLQTPPFNSNSDVLVKWREYISQPFKMTATAQPNDERTRLDTLRDGLIKLGTVLGTVEQIKARLPNMPDDQAKEAVNREFNALITQLKQVDPTNNEIKTLLDGFATQANAILEKIPKSRPPNREIAATAQVSSYTKPKGSSALEAQQARTRMRNLKWGTLLILSGLLIATGYVTLYESVTTFGVKPVGDYLALLLWGFSVETARTTLGGFGIDLSGVGGRTEG